MSAVAINYTHTDPVLPGLRKGNLNMVFILTHNDYDITEVHGVFTTVEKAKVFADTVLGHPNLSWSEPNWGSIWTNTSGGTFVVRSVTLNPEKQD